MTMQSNYTGAARFRPSMVFVALVAITAGLGALLWSGEDLGGVGIFLFVVAGWVVSLTLHEFGHALVAYIAGDRSVADKGYLTLDVRRYADVGTSLILPVVILLIGGIGLPGGAVWINMGLIRKPAMRSLVSAAGPAMTLVCALACLVPIRAGWLDGAEPSIVVALAFLGWIQVIALILNLLPVPGLDGFGILEPHLSASIRRAIAPFAQYGIMIVFVAIFFFSPLSERFFDVTDAVSNRLGGATIDVLKSIGWNEFRFWSN